MATRDELYKQLKKHDEENGTDYSVGKTRAKKADLEALLKDITEVAPVTVEEVDPLEGLHSLPERNRRERRKKTTLLRRANRLMQKMARRAS